MEFERYSDIASCRQRAFFGSFEVGADQKFVIQEKVDGVHIQLGFAPEYPYYLGHRNGTLKMGARFFDVWSTLQRCNHQLQAIQQFVDEGAWFETAHDPSLEWEQDCPCILRLFGELCGPGIKGRVAYDNRDRQRIVLFDAKLRGHMLSPQQFVVLMTRLGIPQGKPERPDEPLVLVPVLGSAIGLAHALNFDCAVDSKILGRPGNLCEGGVLKPWDTVVYNARGHRLCGKHVNTVFQKLFKS